MLTQIQSHTLSTSTHRINGGSQESVFLLCAFGAAGVIKPGISSRENNTLFSVNANKWTPVVLAPCKQTAQIRAVTWCVHLFLQVSFLFVEAPSLWKSSQCEKHWAELQPETLIFIFPALEDSRITLQACGKKKKKKTAPVYSWIVSCHISAAWACSGIQTDVRGVVHLDDITDEVKPQRYFSLHRWSTCFYED